MKKILCLTAFLMVFTAAAFADVRLPDTPTPKVKSVDANMTIKLDKNATAATLIIPKSQLKQFRAALEDLDDSETDNAANAGGTFTRTQTIVSGIFLSMAMIFGGVWAARSRGKGEKINKTIAAGAVLFFVGGLATIAFANAGPPPALRSISSKLFNKETFRYWNSAYGKVKVQTTNDTGAITLIVPDKDEDGKPNGD